MFNWLKRRASAPSNPKPPAARKPAPVAHKPAAAAPPFAASMPLPEVVGEGNTQADWSQWEDSMMALDSQMQDLMPSARVYARDTRPSQLDDIDPFSSVRSRRGR
jgi:hypothetical protein